MKDTVTQQTAPLQTKKPRNDGSAGPNGMALGPVSCGIACLDACRNDPVPVQRRIEDEEEPLQGKFTTIPRAQGVPINDDPALEKEADLMGARALQAKAADAGQGRDTAKPSAPNRTGLPDGLKSGVEALSGLSMDNVRVHYNSDRPARLQAHAYTQGTDIHVAPAQERHLAHEAWHVVQQMEGRVKPMVDVIGREQGKRKRGDVKKIFPEYLSTYGHLQRSVNLNGESNPDNIWSAVTNLVQSRYKRKQTLCRWSSDLIFRSYTDAQTLANDLDTANSKGGALGRCRPDFSSKMISIFNQTYHGVYHRRHIIMSSLMRDAVYATTEANIANNSNNLLIAYNNIVALVGVPPVNNIPQAEANLVYVLHNNPANIVLDQGDWNTAIGFFANNVKKILLMNQAKVFQEYEHNNSSFFNALAYGLQKDIQLNIVSFWENFGPPTNATELTDLLETMYDNAAFDLMSNQSMPKQQGLTSILLKAHGLFVAASSSGNLNDLVSVCVSYIKTGTDIGALVGGKTVKYSEIL